MLSCRGLTPRTPLTWGETPQTPNGYFVNYVSACLPSIGMSALCPKCYGLLYWGWLPIVNTVRNVLGLLAVPSCTGGLCDSRYHFAKIDLDLLRFG